MRTANPEATGANPSVSTLAVVWSLVLLWSLLGGWIFAIVLAGIDEPYNSPGSYFEEIAAGFVNLGPYAVGFLAVSWWSISTLWLVGNAHTKVVKAVVKASIPSLLFGLAWSFALIVGETFDPTFGLDHRPDWMLWQGWPVMGSPLWLLAIAAYMVNAFVQASRRERTV
jgi:hypothetical protein